MANNNPADHGGRRREAEQAELVDLVAAYISRFESLEENLNQLVQCTGVPANTTRANIMRIYRLLKIIKMGGRDIDPRFRLASNLIAVALGGVKCGLLMYVLLGDMPWSTVVPCVLLIAFAFIMN